MRTSTRRSARRGGAAVVAIVLLALGGTTSAVFADHDFNDVPASSPFHDDISWMVDEDITGGFPDGGFHPTAPVSRQAAAAFLHRLFDRVFPVKFDRPFHIFVVCPAATRWAVVESDGSFERGSGGTSASRLTTGTYVVTFNIDVTGCSWQATVGQTGSVGATTGWATVAGRSGNANAVFLTTFDAPPS
jgi:hypothetical protein